MRQICGRAGHDALVASLTLVARPTATIVGVFGHVSVAIGSTRCWAVREKRGVVRLFGDSEDR